MPNRDILVQTMNEWHNICNTIESHLQSCETCVNLDQCGDMGKYRRISVETMQKLDELVKTA